MPLQSFVAAAICFAFFLFYSVRVKHKSSRKKLVTQNELDSASWPEQSLEREQNVENIPEIEFWKSHFFADVSFFYVINWKYWRGLGAKTIASFVPWNHMWCGKVPEKFFGIATRAKRASMERTQNNSRTKKE